MATNLEAKEASTRVLLNVVPPFELAVSIRARVVPVEPWNIRDGADAEQAGYVKGLIPGSLVELIFLGIALAKVEEQPTLPSFDENLVPTDFPVATVDSYLYSHSASIS